LKAASILVANNLPFIRRYARAPLVLPILFKTCIYWVIVFVARLLERFIHFSVIDGNSMDDFVPYLILSLSRRRFVAISLWILVLFLIYFTATEFSRLFGAAEIRRLTFAYRPSELRLNRQ
jgi:hypothetical protein